MGNVHGDLHALRCFLLNTLCGNDDLNWITHKDDGTPFNERMPHEGEGTLYQEVMLHEDQGMKH